MRRSRREHTSDEFGQMPSHAIKGLDPPMIGAPVSITIDGIVERESGRTPSSASVPVWAIVLTLAIMAIVGLIILLAVPVLSPPPLAP